MHISYNIRCTYMFYSIGMRLQNLKTTKNRIHLYRTSIVISHVFHIVLWTRSTVHCHYCATGHRGAGEIFRGERKGMFHRSRATGCVLQAACCIHSYINDIHILDCLLNQLPCGLLWSEVMQALKGTGPCGYGHNVKFKYSKYL